MPKQYIILLTFPEDDTFLRILSFPGDASAKQLHRLILDAVAYPPDTIATFDIVDNENNLQKELLCDADFLELSDKGVPTLLMDDLSVAELFADPEHLSCLYVFDFFGNRAFHLRLFNTENTTSDPKVVQKRGEAPAPESEWDAADNNIFSDDADLSFGELNEDELYDSEEPPYDSEDSFGV